LIAVPSQKFVPPELLTSPLAAVSQAATPRQWSATTVHPISMPAVQVPGLVSEQQEIIVNTMSEAGVSKVSVVFPDTEAISSSRENRMLLKSYLKNRFN